MPANATFTTLIAGGGPAALEAALTLRDIAPDIRVGLLVPEREYLYRPVSVFDPFAGARVRRYAYAELAVLGIDVHHDRLMRVEADRRVVVTDHGAEHPYDALLVALGSQRRNALPRVLTFGGVDEIERMHGLVQDVEGGYARRLAFVAPAGVSWTLPIYELALLTAERAHDLSLDRLEITLATHEQRPLEVFGDGASALIEKLLAEAGVRFVTGDDFGTADRVVALPVPAGRRIAGLPADELGFLPVDAHGAVQGVDGVWAAGDCTDRPIKQGGLAAQEAAAAARAIAAAAAGTEPEAPDDLVLRAMLILRRHTLFLRRRLDGIDPGTSSPRALWWPPAKIAGERLTPFLDRIDREAGTLSLEHRAAATTATDPG